MMRTRDQMVAITSTSIKSKANQAVNTKCGQDWNWVWVDI